MSVKRAQTIANELYTRYGVDITNLQNEDISDFRDKLEEFVELEVDTAELSTPDDIADDDGALFDEDFSDELEV